MNGYQSIKKSMDMMDSARIFDVRNELRVLFDHWQSASTSTVVAIFGIALATYVVQGIIRSVWFHPLSRFPGPKLWAAFYLPFLVESYIHGRGARLVAALHRKYGPIVRIGPNHLAVDGQIGWPQIFGNRKEEFAKKSMPFPGREDNLITASKEQHRRMRRQLSHAFSDAALTQQEKTVSEYTELLLSRLASYEGKEMDIVEWLNFTTFDIIGELAFSSSYGSLASDGYHPWILSIFKSVRLISLRRILSNYPVLLYLAVGIANLTGSDKGKKVHEQAAEKAKTRLQLGQDLGNGRLDFISYMLRKTRDGDEGMNEKQVLSTSPTVVLAGSETTATALSGLFFYLGQNSSAYRLLCEEIRSNFQFREEITMQSTQKLEYLQSCINEILRVYPPVAETPARVSPGDVIDGHFVPAGTILSVFQWATFHNPEHFLKPDAFLPQRWLPSTHPSHEPRFKDDHREVFKPFSYGTRDCIGKNLALAEMRLIVARFLYMFDYELSPGQESWHSDQRTYVIWERGALNLTVKSRDTNK